MLVADLRKRAQPLRRGNAGSGGARGGAERVRFPTNTSHAQHTYKSTEHCDIELPRVDSKNCEGGLGETASKTTLNILKSGVRQSWEL